MLRYSFNTFVDQLIKTAEYLGASDLILYLYRVLTQKEMYRNHNRISELIKKRVITYFVPEICSTWCHQIIELHGADSFSDDTGKFDTLPSFILNTLFCLSPDQLLIFLDQIPMKEDTKRWDELDDIMTAMGHETKSLDDFFGKMNLHIAFRCVETEIYLMTCLVALKSKHFPIDRIYGPDQIDHYSHSILRQWIKVITNDELRSQIPLIHLEKMTDSEVAYSEFQNFFQSLLAAVPTTVCITMDSDDTQEVRSW